MASYNSKKSILSKMTLLIAALFVVLLVGLISDVKAESSPTFSEGTELYVVAPSGLILRSLPTAESRNMGTIPFGSRLIVLNEIDSIASEQKIGWVTGNWVRVEYEGQEGYMFDGYLTDLPLPEYDFELSQESLEFTYPFESWAEINFGILKSDTIESKYNTKIVDVLGSGDRLIKTRYDDMYKLEAIMENVRIMDIYHLLQSMIDHNNDLNTFIESTTFIENEDGQLSMVKIDIDNGIVIKEMKGGNVKLTLRDKDYPCDSE